MTAMMRQICKQILTILAAALLICGQSGASAAATLVTTIVADPLTGVAIEGYDAVTYFTEPEPQPGSPNYVHYWGGVPWYFVSAANRDVFVRAPQIYAPRFGGHCAMSLARGYLSDGKPNLYAIEKMKLYLFYSTANREAFLSSAADAAEKAEASWRRLAKDLSGPPLPEPEAAGPADPDAEAAAEPADQRPSP